MVEEAEGQGPGIGSKSRQGSEIGGFGAFGGDRAPVVVDEMAEVIGQVMILLEITIKNGRKDNSKSVIINSDAVDNVDDVDDEYCCVSDQALVEYATCTILPLLDTTLRRYLPHLPLNNCHNHLVDQRAHFLNQINLSYRLVGGSDCANGGDRRLDGGNNEGNNNVSNHKGHRIKRPGIRTNNHRHTYIPPQTTSKHESSSPPP